MTPNDHEHRGDGQRRTDRRSRREEHEDNADEGSKGQPVSDQRSHQQLSDEQLQALAAAAQTQQQEASQKIQSQLDEIKASQEGIRGEVAAIKTKIEKPEEPKEPKKEEEKPASTVVEPSKPTTTPPAPAPQKKPSFFDQIGKGVQYLGRAAGLGVQAVAIPFFLAAKAVEGVFAAADKFFYGMAQQLGLKPKDTPPKPA